MLKPTGLATAGVLRCEISTRPMSAAGQNSPCESLGGTAGSPQLADAPADTRHGGVGPGRDIARRSIAPIDAYDFGLHRLDRIHFP
jgi:hypothetical protein